MPWPPCSTSRADAATRIAPYDGPGEDKSEGPALALPPGRRAPWTPYSFTESPLAVPQTGMHLHTADGARKYLTAGERDAFLREAERADRTVRTLCMTLAYGGCRLSEALALTADRVDLAAGVLVFESLKKRRTGIYRSVPVPPALLEALDLAHGIRERQGSDGDADRTGLARLEMTAAGWALEGGMPRLIRQPAFGLDVFRLALAESPIPETRQDRDHDGGHDDTDRN
jgi:integrase